MRNTALLLFCSLVTLLSGCMAPPATSAPGTTSFRNPIRPFEQQLKAQEQQINNLDRIVQQLSTTVSTNQNELIALRAEIVKLKTRKPIPVIQQQKKRKSVKPSNPVAATPQSATDIYRNAFSAYTNDNYSIAIDGFNQFLQDYPRNPYVPNAHFWKGEAFFAQGALQSAIEEFSNLVTGYPDAHKAPDALLKLARIFLTLDQRSQARASLFTLQHQYPNSSVNKRIPKDLLEILE